MSSDSEVRQSISAQLQGILSDAEESYVYLKRKHENDTRLEVALASILVWVSALVVLGVSSFRLFGAVLFSNAPAFFLLITAVAAASGLLTYAVRRRRIFPFAELGALIGKMKGGAVSSEDGLKLIDATQQAMLAVKKGKVDSVFGRGVLAFILVAVFGQNVAVGLLAGIVVYLYFRHETIREYEKEEARYAESKSAVLQRL